MYHNQSCAQMRRPELQFRVNRPNYVFRICVFLNVLARNLPNRVFSKSCIAICLGKKTLQKLSFNCVPSPRGGARKNLNLRKWNPRKTCVGICFAHCSPKPSKNKFWHEVIAKNTKGRGADKCNKCVKPSATYHPNLSKSEPNQT